MPVRGRAGGPLGELEKQSPFFLLQLNHIRERGEREPKHLISSMATNSGGWGGRRRQSFSSPHSSFGSPLISPREGGKGKKKGRGGRKIDSKLFFGLVFLLPPPRKIICSARTHFPGGGTTPSPSPQCFPPSQTQHFHNSLMMMSAVHVRRFKKFLAQTTKPTSPFSFLQLIPQISSLTPVTTAVPLIGVLALTAIKDAYDDIVSFIFH